MTAKRFTLKEYITNHYAMLDNGEEIAYVDHKSAFSICELLNELHEENQKLKKENAELEKFRYSIFKRMGELYEE